VLTRAQLKAVLHGRGLRLAKRRGQNMLVSPTVRDRLVEAMELRPSDLVVEIGAGTGALTEALAVAARRVIAFEIDRGLVGVLREQLGSVANVEIRHEDFLEADLAELAGDAQVGREDLVIAGNLPYSITTPVITRVLESGVAYRAAYFTVQREVAQRLLAKPGSRGRGAITLLVEYHTVARRLLNVPRNAFEPVPDVESVLIGLVARQTPAVAPRDPALMFAVIRAGFGARRKVLKNALRRLKWNALPDENVSAAGSVSAAARLADAARLGDAIGACGLDPAYRGEQLTLQQFADLSDALI
jgi:16S rRNA (adenine1518-N6/adenine1519-N6)-dimethyltransferase